MKPITTGQIKQLVERADAGQILKEDLDAFLREPERWRQIPANLDFAKLPAWMQAVYNELGIPCHVPPVPLLTKKQEKSLTKFGFRLFFVPAIIERQYPENFQRLNWSLDHMVSEYAQHIPLPGRWIAIETLSNNGYPDDPFKEIFRYIDRRGKNRARFFGHFFLRIAGITGFPEKAVCLPTLEEWNFLGNLFNFLRISRCEKLPDLGTADSMEWCKNADQSSHLAAGGNHHNLDGSGLQYVGYTGENCSCTGFRILIAL